MLSTPKLDSFANRHKKQDDSIDMEAGGLLSNETIELEDFGPSEHIKQLLFSCKCTQFL